MNSFKVQRMSLIWKHYKSVLVRPFCDKSYADFEDSQRVEKSVNEVTLLGRVGSDPIRSEFQGRSVVRFSLATSFTYKSSGNGEPKQKTDWHNVATYDLGLINYVTNYVKKGQRLYVCGRLTYSSSDSSTSGKNAYVLLKDIIFLGS